jgi:hypothetical protein
MVVHALNTTLAHAAMVTKIRFWNYAVLANLHSSASIVLARGGRQK